MLPLLPCCKSLDLRGVPELCGAGSRFGSPAAGTHMTKKKILLFFPSFFRIPFKNKVCALYGRTYSILAEYSKIICRQNLEAWPKFKRKWLIWVSSLKYSNGPWLSKDTHWYLKSQENRLLSSPTLYIKCKRNSKASAIFWNLRLYIKSLPFSCFLGINTTKVCNKEWI